MNIAFVQPPNPQRSGDWKKMGVSRPPINLALLAAYVRRYGHKPVIYDLDWFDGGVNEAVRDILKYNPDVVCITCLTPRLEIALSIARGIKEWNPKVKIIMGGAHVNGTKDLYPDIDYAIYGEGEEALIELLKAIETKSGVESIRNLIYRQGSEAIVNKQRPFIKDLDRLPFPAWDLLDLENYKDNNIFDGPHMGVMTSRGCPWNCIFCSSGVAWGRNVRFRSVENVVEELKQITGLGIRNIMFYDDTFTLNKPRFLSICEGMARLNLKYYCQLRVDTIDDEIAEALKMSGCIMAAIGVESGDAKILKILRKGITKNQVRRAVATLKSAGVPVLASYILGSPGDTHESIRKTIDFARELDTDQAKFMICTPFPGAELFDMAVDKGVLSYGLTPSQYAKITYYQHVTANLSEVSDEELLKYQEDAYKTFK